MENSFTQNLCRILIGSALQRCRLADNLCRLSVRITSSSSNHSVLISISDTGVGSCLEEFQGMEDSISDDKWDGVLSIKTTSICDSEVYDLRLDLKEKIVAKRLTKLPLISKNGGKFSGTETSLCTNESIDVISSGTLQFLQKMCMLKIPKVAVELIVDRTNKTGSKCEKLFQDNDGINLPFSIPNIERLVSGLEDHVLRHGNTLDTECQSCFSSREHLKAGMGTTSNSGGLRKSGQLIEAVIIITDLPEPSAPSCPRACCSTTEIVIPQVQQKIHFDRNLLKKTVKLAMDDLKEKYAGILLSEHAIKIQSYAPDLAKTIAGLILSSDDNAFQEECISLLGLQPQEMDTKEVEDCISQKITAVIGMNDRKPQRNREAAPFLFEHENTDDAKFVDEEDEDGDEYDIMDI